MAFMVNDTYDFKSHIGTYIGPSDDDYRNGEKYELLCQKMSDGRFSVFKSSAHYKERPGYKVYPTKEAINQDFTFK